MDVFGNPETLAEVRLIPLGEPVIGGATIFEGSSAEAREVLRGMSAAERRELSVWTLGHIFTPEQFEAERPGHEHDPLEV
jgi:hypothetical protein